MLTTHAPSVLILNQFPSGSMGVHLVFQVSDKKVKSSYNTIKQQITAKFYSKVNSLYFGDYIVADSTTISPFFLT